MPRLAGGLAGVVLCFVVLLCCVVLAGWMELKTPEGKVYYQNSISKTTQWARPSPPKAKAAANDATQLNTATYNSTPSPPVGGAAGNSSICTQRRVCVGRGAKRRGASPGVPPKARKGGDEVALGV